MIFLRKMRFTRTYPLYFHVENNLVFYCKGKYIYPWRNPLKVIFTSKRHLSIEDLEKIKD